jgi:hypothetical protein
MSLINEALKKAQRQRSLDTAPLSSAPSGVAAAAVTTHVRSASHKRSHAPLWFGFGLVALGAVAAGLVMRYGFDSPSAAPMQTAPVKTVAVAPLPVVATPPPPAAAQAALDSQPAASAPMVVLPAIPSVKPANVAPPAASSTPAAKPAPVSSAAPAAPATPATPVAPVAPTPASTEAPTETVAAVAPAPVVPVAVLSPAEREAKIYAFLTNLRLTGVRGLDRDARVLMNERVWRLNDIVSPDLGLRLSAIRPNLLVFTDAQGKTYEKPY